MIEAQLGLYRILSELGSGGMGKVYLAEVVKPAVGLEPGAKVALKVVHPHLLETPGFFKRFMQEAELGRRVRHENVVSTFDVDALTHEGSQHHFMVMEHVQGKSLRDLLHELGAIPETLLREIALQTVAGLAAIHAEGIVHRDLKPENVMITDDHEIRIMDLGVAKLQEATLALTKEGQFAGSLLYAAPEQFRRDDDVGPAADLYSLGLLLYELATGQHPFRCDDASEIIHAHLSEVPSSVHERNEDVSLFFSKLVDTLLAKRPADRFASSEELYAILEGSEHSTWWTERAPTLSERQSHLPKLRVRRETKLHGRVEDLALLRSLYEQAAAGRGNTVLIEGEAGIGKTRLVDSFLRGLDNEDIHVLYGSYPPSGGMGGLSDSIIGKFGETRLADALMPYLAAMSSLVPAFAALVKHESPPTGSESLGGDALQAVVVHLVRALAAEKPTIWVLDDLNFAPQESHDFLLAMARAVEDHRVLLVATARPGVDFSEFSRLENFRRTALDRLGAREIIELLEDALHSENLADKLGAKIARKSDGVPFFIFEMIRGLEEGQFIRQQADGSYVQTEVIDAIEVPSAVKDLIEGRMRGLTEDQRAILDAGAVQGMTFEPALLARVLEEKKVRILRQMAEIERRFGLIRGEATSCTFDQNQIQEVLYQDLLPELRTEYHTLIAEAHSERCGEVIKGDDAVFLAHHHLRGSRPQEAMPHLESAFDHLESGYRNDALLDLARRALATEGLLGGQARVEVLLRQAGRLDLLGRRDVQRTALDEAVALADEIDDAALRGKARRSLGLLHYALSNHESARASFAESLELARIAGDRKLEAQATGNLGVSLEVLGRIAEAQEHHERARALSAEIGDRVGEAAATGNLGNVFKELSRFTDAREHHERDRAICREIGDRKGEAQATGNLGVVLLSIGNHAEAQEHLEHQRAISREIGFRHGEAQATGNLGTLFKSVGRLAQAQEHYERQLALSREIGNPQGEAVAALNLGVLSENVGCYFDAREYLERVLAIAREIGFRHLEGHVLGTLAGIEETEGDRAAAGRLYEQALTLLREVGATQHASDLLVALGRFEMTRDHTERTAAHIAEALSLARESGSPGTILSATVEQARLPGGDTAAALAALEECEERVGHAGKMNARFSLWSLTGDPSHLAEAHRLLLHLRDHAPGDCRDSMIRNVPLHRDIMRAWAEHANA